MTDPTREQARRIVEAWWQAALGYGSPPSSADLLRLIDAIAAALGEKEAWAAVAAQSNRDVDAYLRTVDPTLPEHYGMPVDGVRKAFNAALADLRERCADIVDEAFCGGANDEKHARGDCEYCNVANAIRAVPLRRGE